MQVSVLGLGKFHLRWADSDAEADQIVNEALDAGVNFFDNAGEYHDGVSEERLGRALKGKRDRAILMTKVCTHGRDKKIVVMQQLEESLRRLQTATNLYASGDFPGPFGEFDLRLEVRRSATGIPPFSQP